MKISEILIPENSVTEGMRKWQKTEPSFVRDIYEAVKRAKVDPDNDNELTMLIGDHIRISMMTYPSLIRFLIEAFKSVDWETIYGCSQ